MVTMLMHGVVDVLFQCCSCYCYGTICFVIGVLLISTETASLPVVMLSMLLHGDVVCTALVTVLFMLLL